MLLKQNWHIWRRCQRRSWVIAEDGTRPVPDIRKDMVGSCGRRDRTPRCREGCVAHPVSGLWLESEGASAGAKHRGVGIPYQQSSSSSTYRSCDCGAMVASCCQRQDAGLSNVVAVRGKSNEQTVGWERMEAGGKSRETGLLSCRLCSLRSRRKREKQMLPLLNACMKLQGGHGDPLKCVEEMPRGTDELRLKGRMEATQSLPAKGSMKALSCVWTSVAWHVSRHLWLADGQTRGRSSEASRRRGELEPPESS
jgi:hypothetical protein